MNKGPGTSNKKAKVDKAKPEKKMPEMNENED